ncbi:uncharacterized protein K02A2.6-like [Frankliniella occidentalis]|uniref:RNA-directed DNA polymerase n=1 Tax=Frankliniella occidentalis TaxID=133901 RepID=A0A9C6WYB0_FRAOC|nr:uncharacterized protein K02A2.6-like [Frankliniella occidentalis]
MAAPAFNIPPLRYFEPAEISVTGWVQLFDGYCTLVKMPGEVINENALIRLLRQKYEPPGLVSTNRLQFNRRVQLQTESATDYVTALQVLADRSNNLTFFQAKELCEKDDALRNEVRFMAQHMAGLNAASYQPKQPSLKFKPFTYRRETPHGSNGSYKKQNHEQPRSTWNPCFRCSRKHDGRNCPAKDWECHKCHKKGHISKCCPQRLVKVVEPQVPVAPPTAEPPLSHLGQQPPLSSIEEEVERLFRVSKEPVQVILLNHVSQSPPVLVRLSVNGIELEMEVDTGAGVTVVSYAVYLKFLKSCSLSPSPFVLNSVSGSIKVFGQLSVSVALPSQPPVQLILVVCDTVAPVRSLLGRPWLDVLFKDWRKVFLPANVISSVSDRVQQLQHMFPKVFDSLNDDPITPFKAKLLFIGNVKDIFAPAYSLPYSLVDVIDSLIEKLVSSNKVFPVTYSENASPCVPIKKKDGSYRLCVDFKRTLNTQLKVQQYPLPRIDDIFASLADASVFTVIDLSDAYLQLELDEASKKYVTANTHQGLYRYNRLIYGIASAPAIFQQVMDCILKGIPGVKCYLDDTLWFVNQVEYLGNIISKEGRKPSPDKIQAVLKARVPTTKKQVLSFLGLFTYYFPLLPNFSAISKPLRLLSDPIVWDASAQSSYDECKKLFLTSGVLVNYNPELPIVVLSDASPDGLGAILCHKVGNTERPVAFASCALTPCQQNYAQIDREALGIMFAINKFHKFIWGRQFILVTDNAPLRHILSPDKSIPVLSAQRLQHWSYILQAYTFNIEHRKAELMSHVDALSRVPPPTEFFDDIALHSNFSEAFEISSIARDLPLNSSVIAEETKRDPELSKLSLQCKVGWPDWDRFLDPLVKPFFKLREQLSLEKGCVLYASRVVIPKSLLKQVIEILHEDRSHDYVPWPEAKEPMQRVHVDLYTFKGIHFFLFADSFSKWIHVQRMVRTTASDVISVLSTIFAIWGDPQTLVSDNGPPFDSFDLIDFCTARDIILTHSPAYHPESNGYAERSVQIAKKSIEKMFLEYQAKDSTHLQVFPIDICDKFS